MTLRLQGDSEGNLAGRIDARFGPSRWLLLGGGALVPVDERIAPAGYLERRYTADEILGETWTEIGAAAGPVSFGPLAPKGLFARAVDPTAGSWSWSALSDRDRFALEGSLDEPSRRGLALARMPAIGIGAGAWALEDRDGTQWRGAALSAASDRALPGRLAVLLGETLPASAPRDPARTAAEGWLYRVPPLRTSHYLRGGLGWHATIPLGAARELALLTETWVQREGRAPPPWAYTGVATVSSPRWTAGLRLSRAAPGFLDAWGDPLDRSLLLAAGLDGRWGAASNRRTLGATWELAGGWDEGVPAPPRRELAFRYRRSAGELVLQRRSAALSVECGTAGDPEEVDLDLDVRVRPPGVGRRRVLGPRRAGEVASRPAAYLDGEASVAWERDAGGTGWELGLGCGWSRSVGSRRRTLSLEVGAGLEREPGDVGSAGDVPPPSWEAWAAATVPVGGGGRLAFDLDYREEELHGRMTLEWTARPSAATGRESSAPTGSRS